MNFNKNIQLFLIFILYLSACIEINLFLPVLPNIMIYFSVDAAQIQKVLSVNFIATCISSLFIGTLSDSLGRKFPVLLSLFMFFIGSLFTLFANHFSFFLVGRFAQGVGAGGIFTLGMAIIGDLFPDLKSVGARNSINSLMPLFVALTPILGGVINQFYGFRGVCLMITLTALTSLLMSWIFLKETLIPEKRKPFHFTSILHHYQIVSTTLSFWLLTLMISLLSAGYLAFNAQIAILFMTEFEMKPTLFCWFQVTVLATYLIGSLSGNILIKILEISNIKKIGALLILSGAGSLVFTGWLIPKEPIAMVASMLLYVLGYVWLQMLFFSELLQIYPEKRGTIASLRTGSRLLITTIIVELAATTYNSTILPIAMIELMITISVVFIMLSYTKILFKKCSQDVA